MPIVKESLIQNSSNVINRLRLAALHYLDTARRDVPFYELLQALRATKGNLSSHMRKLEEEGLVQIKKEFVERKPKTSFRITAKGKKTLREFLKLAVEMLKELD